MFTAKHAAIPLIIIAILHALTAGLFLPVVMQLLSPDSLNDLTVSNQNFVQNNGLVLGFSLAVALSPAGLFIAPLLGYCSDQFGRKYLLGACLLFSCVAYLIGYFSIEYKSMLLLLIADVFFSAGYAAFPIILAALTDVSNRTQKIAFFSVVCAAMLGINLLAGYSQILFYNNYLTYQNLAILSFIIAAGNFILLYLFLPETNSQENQLSAASLVPFIYLKLNVFRNQQTLILLLIFMLFCFGWGLYYQDTYIYLTNTNYFSFEQVNLIVSGKNYFMIGGIAILLPLFLRFLSLKNTLLLGIIITALGRMYSTWSNYHYTHLKQLSTVDKINALTAGLTAGIVIILFWVLISNSASYKKQGFVMGIVISAWMLMWTISWLMSEVTYIIQSLPFWVNTAIIAGIFIICYFLVYFLLCTGQKIIKRSPEHREGS